MVLSRQSASFDIVVDQDDASVPSISGAGASSVDAFADAPLAQLVPAFEGIDPFASPIGNGVGVHDVVFIDSRVPDLQDLLGGLKPGEKAFVINDQSDGLDQIAAILKSEHLSHLTGIQIVAHGASGSLELGSTMLDASDLAGHAGALASIGGALDPGADLSLYSCNVAEGASGQQFISNLSQLTGGVDVMAATHIIGQTAGGENWTLNAASGLPGALGTPFTANALAHFHADLPANPVTLYESDGTTVVGTFTTIQAAVNDAEAISGNNDIISVAAGTYQEQVLVDGSQVQNLTIEGAGQGQTIIESPDEANLAVTFTHTQVPDQYGHDINALVGVENNANVTIENLTIDGNNQGIVYAEGGNYVSGNSGPRDGGDLMGIAALNSSVTATNVHITGTEDVESGVLQGGQGNMGAFIDDTNASTQTFNISGSTIDNFQRDGIFVEGAGLTADVDNNTVTGVGTGAVNLSQNLVECDNGAVGSITGNTVTGISDANGGSLGILMFQAGDGGAVNNNTVTGLSGNVDSFGIFFGGTSAPTATGNDISDQGLALADDGGSPEFLGGPYPFAVALDQSGNTYTDDVQNYFFYAGTTTTTAWDVTGTGGPDEMNGGAGNDVFTVTGGAPNSNIFVGNGGINTVQGYTTGSSVAIDSAQWAVTNGGINIDILTGIEKVVIAGQTFDLVDTLGTNVGGFQSVSAAVASQGTDGFGVGDIIAQNTTGTTVIFFVEDTAAHVASNFDSLDANVAIIQSVQFTDSGTPDLDLTASQVVNDQTLIGKITSTYTLVVNDSAANVASNIDSLETYAASISEVVFNDGGTPTLTITATQAANDTAILAEIQGPYDLDVTGVTGQAYGSYEEEFNASNQHIVSIYSDNSGGDTVYGYISGLSFSGTPNNSIFAFQSAPDVTVSGLGSNSTFYMGGTFSSGDTIAGGAGTNLVVLDGNYTGANAVTLGATTMTNIQDLVLDSGFSYNLTTNAATVASGQMLTVNGSALGSSDDLTLNTSAQTTGTLDVFTGNGTDSITLGGGNNIVHAGTGTDTITGGAGNDEVIFTTGFSAADTVTGGTGTNLVYLDGNYTGGNAVTLGASTLTGVQELALERGFSYKLTTNAATVGTGQTFEVDGLALMAGNNLTLNTSAQTTGSLVVYTGNGTDAITLGGGSNYIHAGLGVDTVTGGAGNDQVFFTTGFATSDTITGGSGTNLVILDGNYTGGSAVTMGATTMTNIQDLVLDGGFSYHLTTNAATVASNHTLEVNALGLGASNTLTFNGSADAGHLDVFCGAGTNVITGGNASDTFNAGSGTDTFVYTSAAQSTSTTYDTISGMNFSHDHIELGFTVGAVQTAITSGTLSSGTFNANLTSALTGLGAHHAVLFTPNAGTLAGQTFLIIDANGTAGYQAGEDIVIHLTGETGTLSTSDFIT